MALMEQLGYLKRAPQAKPVKTIKKMTVATKSGQHARDYIVHRGFSHYMFGPMAPRLYQETLNPKYVRPSNPLLRSRDEKQDEPKNMRVTSMNREAEESSGENDHYGHIKEKKKEEEIALHTHNVNAVIAEADKILSAKPLEPPDKAFIQWPTGPPNIPPTAPTYKKNSKKEHNFSGNA